MHRPAMEAVRKALTKIGNVPYHLGMLSNRMKLANWQQLSDFFKSAIAIEDAITSLSLPENAPSRLLGELITLFKKDCFRPLFRLLSSTVLSLLLFLISVLYVSAL